MTLTSPPGDDYSELVDCRGGYPLPHYPSHVFWDGFNDVSQRLRDPNTREPRLLKQKDWPPGEDFCEKLPRRLVKGGSTERERKVSHVSPGLLTWQLHYRCPTTPEEMAS